MSAQTFCERCGLRIYDEPWRVRLTLVDAVSSPSTDLQGDFHHACAAELFHQFRGKTRNAPGSAAAAPGETEQTP